MSISYNVNIILLVLMISINSFSKTNANNYPKPKYLEIYPGTKHPDTTSTKAAPLTTIGFYDITKNSPYSCSDGINLKAYSRATAGGYITPGFRLRIFFDSFIATQNSFSLIIDNNVAFNAPVGSMRPPGGERILIMGVEYQSPSTDGYEVEWCDNVPDGIFKFDVYDNANWNMNRNGTLNHNDGTVCNRESLGPITGIATFSGPGVTNYGNGTGYFDASIAGLGTHTITYCWNNEAGFSGCSSQTIVVGPAANAGNDQTVCKGESITIGSQFTGNTGNAPYIYSWSPIANLNNPLIANPIATPTTTTIYKVDVSDDNGNGCTVSDQLTVLVNPTPEFNIHSDTPNYCTGKLYKFSCNFTGITPTIANYQWTTDKGTLTSNNQSTTQFSTTQKGAHKLSCTVTDVNGCKTIREYNITVSQLNINIGNDTTICQGNNITIQTDTKFSSYLWQNNSTETSFTASQQGWYKLKVINNSGCTATDSLYLTVKNIPPINFDSEIKSCTNVAVSIDAGSAYDQYLWQDGSTDRFITTNTAGKYSVKVWQNGNICTTSDTTEVKTLPLPIVNLGNDAEICENTQITITPGSYFKTYLWNNGSTDASITTATTGKYSVEVSDASGCKNSDTIIIKVNPLPYLWLGNDITVCDGNTVILNAGTGYKSYLWSTGQQTQSISTTQAGTFFATVTNQYKCATTDTIKININKLPEFNLGNDISTCKEGKTIFTPSKNFSSYLWQDGISTKTYLAETTGEYSLTVTDKNGCSSSDAVNLTIFTELEMTLGMDTAICDGNKITLAPDKTFASYLWQDGKQTATYQTKIEGEYSLKVIDNNGCSASDAIYLTINPAPEINLGKDTAICNGNIVTLSSEKIFSEYLWQDTSNTDTYQAYMDGEYSLKVIDKNGCTASDNVYLTVYPTPKINLGKDTAICNGNKIIFSSGKLFADYLWQDASKKSNYTAQTQGEYNLKVIDKNGCTTSDSVYLTVNSNPEINLGKDTAICNGNKITLAPDKTFASYLWQDGKQTATYQTKIEGKYSLKVIDNNSCSASDDIYLTVNPTPEINLGKDTTICNGEKVVFTTDKNFSEYLWQDSNTNKSYTAETTGEYSLKIIDKNGCSASDAIFLNIDTPPVIDLGQDTTICKGDTLILDAKSGYHNYKWQNNETTHNIKATTSGIYKVIVTTAINCSSTDSVKLTVAPLPDLNLSNDTSICQNKNITFTAGNSHAKYLWQDGSNNETFTTNTQGIYHIKITDINNCSSTDTVNLSINPLPNPNLGKDTAICYGQNITISPGNNFASWLWHNKSTKKYFTTDTSGIFTVTVSNKFDCSSTDDINIDINSLPIIDLGRDTTICIGDTIILDTKNNVNSYLWNTGSTNKSIKVSDTGIYSVKLTDTNTCTNTDTIKISINYLPQINLGNDTTLCFGNTITLNAGINADAYIWQDGTNNQYFTATQKGNYSVTITDKNNCKNSSEINIDITPPIEISTIKKDINCNGFAEGKIIISSPQKTNNLVFSNNNGKSFDNNDGTFEYLISGTYYIIAKDSMQCLSAIDTVIINQPDVITISSRVKNISCYGLSDGEVNFTSKGGNAPLKYYFDNDTTKNFAIGKFHNLTAGQHFITVIDQKNCRKDTIINITKPNPIDITSVELENPKCATSDDGTIKIAATGSESFLYSIDNGATFQNNNGQFTELQSGIYHIIIKNQNQCTKTGDTIQINAPPKITVSAIDTINPTCNTSTNGSITITANGGTGILTYKTDNNNYSEDGKFTNLKPNKYIIYIIDENSCTKQVNIDLTATQQQCIKIPTAFTPNNDGYNDNWQIDKIESYPNISIQIYDRWNRLLFKANTPYQSWDGTSNGEIVPNGTYYYIIYLNKNTQPIMGYLTLTR